MARSARNHIRAPLVHTPLDLPTKKKHDFFSSGEGLGGLYRLRVQAHNAKNL